MIKKFLWLLLLLGLLCLSAMVVIEHLYSSVAADMGAQTNEQHQALAENLKAVDFQTIPFGLAAASAANHLKAAEAYQASMALNLRLLQLSPLDLTQWFRWLDNVLLGQEISVSGQQMAAAVKHLDSIGSNEVWLRLGLSRLALSEWYRLTPDARKSFRLHLDWMVAYNPEMLWGHAHLVRRDALLCRIYLADDIKLPLC